VPGRRCRLPDVPRPNSSESDPVQRLLAFAYLQAQKTQNTEELQKDAATLSAVLAAQEHIASAGLDLEQTLDFIADGARRLTGAGGAAIALREGDNVVCRARAGLIAPELGSFLNGQSGVCGDCLNTGEVQLCDDTEHDQRVDLWVCRNLGVRSILAVPLRRQSEVLGIIVVFSGWAGGFREADSRSLKLLAGLVIEALWSQEVRARQPLAPEPAALPEIFEVKAEAETKIELETKRESHAAAEPPAEADSISAALAEFREAIAASVLPHAAAPAVELPEAEVAIEPAAGASAELAAPAFAVLERSEPRSWGRVLTIIVAVIGLLSAGVEVGLWRGAHVHRLTSHFSTAGLKPIPAPVVTTPAPTPETPTGATAPPPDASSAIPEQTGVSSGPSQLLSIRSWSKREGTTIALFLEGPAKWQSELLKDPARIYFDLENTQLAPEMLGKSREGLAIPVNDGLVSRVRVGQREQSAARVVIDLAAAAEYSAVLSPAEPYRLMIVVRRVQSQPSAPNAEPEPKKPPTAALRAPAGALVHPKIVIDPGHGGTEDGAIGHGGLKEKDLVLAIAKALGDRLANRLGAEVIYTRTSDLTVPLDTRATIANQAGADLFISIHANSSDDPNARGVETYYMSDAPSLMAVSLSGHDPALKAGTMRTVSETHKLDESHKLATEVQRAMYQAFGGEKGILNRGVKQAPFIVLLDAEMPSILAEVAFVTSPADEHKLDSAQGQDAIADALYRGIAHYVSASHRGKVVASLSAGSGQ
jgi:N-acetylmuramoyl-L-alanine amidase